MKQNEATPQRPYYSVCYQYKGNPYTLWSCNRYGNGKFGHGKTQSGTDDFSEAKALADRLILENGICYAQVSKTEDCYNHTQVYKAGVPG